MDPASLTLTMIFKAPHFVQSLATMLGLIEGVDQKLDRLVGSDYEAASRHLLELSKDLKPETRDFLLKEAWKRFGAAVALEEGERKALSFIGLAFSQYHLGEKQLAIETLSELTRYSYVNKSTERKTMATLAGATVAASVLWIPAAIFGATTYLALSGEPALRAKMLAKARDGAKTWLLNVPKDERVELLKTKAQEVIDLESSMPSV